METNAFDLVLPIIAQDVKKIAPHIRDLFRYLPVRRIVLIGSASLYDSAAALLKDNRICLMDEERLIDTKKCREIVSGIGGADAVRRTGWYIQQFLKLQYASICRDSFYLTWDGDMIPLRPVSMFSPDGKPYFDLSGEYHAAYFRVIRKLFPELERTQRKSFIAEHMLFHCDTVRALISEIEANRSLPGDRFYEKILHAVDPAELTASGFSEFETYGTYARSRRPQLYAYRDWKSVRSGGRLFQTFQLDAPTRKWFAKHYSAIVIEDWETYNPRLHRLFCSRAFQTLVPSRIAVESLNRLSRAKARLLKGRSAPARG